MTVRVLKLTLTKAPFVATVLGEKHVEIRCGPDCWMPTVAQEPTSSSSTIMDRG